MKKILTVLVLIALVLSLSSCKKLFDNGIDPFGNARLLSRNELAQDITWLSYDDVLYCRVGTLVGNPKKGECTAAFNEYDNYSYQIFPLSDYEGLIAVRAYSKINMVDMYSLYASVVCVSIDKDLVDDFPHEDTWYNGGLNKTINGAIYSPFGTTTRDYSNNAVLFSEGGIDYFEVEGQPDWIARRNERDSDRFDLLYNNKNIEVLPYEMLLEANEEILKYYNID